MSMYGPGRGAPDPYGGYRPEPAYDEYYEDEADWQPRRRKGSGVLIGFLVVFVLVLLAGGAGAVYFLTRSDGKGSPAAQPSAQPEASGPVESGSPAPSASKSSAPEAARVAKVGECLKIGGTKDNPAITKVACGAGTFQVLKRLDGTADRAGCVGVERYSDYYFFDSEVNAEDFVLCLQRRL